MPIRHVALFRFVEGTTPDQVAEIRRRLLELPPLIPEILSYQVGPDATEGNDNFEFGVTGEFASLEAFHAYVAHPAHQAVATELIYPIKADRAAIQFEI